MDDVGLPELYPPSDDVNSNPLSGQATPHPRESMTTLTVARSSLAASVTPRNHQETTPSFFLTHTDVSSAPSNAIPLAKIPKRMRGLVRKEALQMLLGGVTKDRPITKPVISPSSIANPPSDSARTPALHNMPTPRQSDRERIFLDILPHGSRPPDPEADARVVPVPPQPPKPFQVTETNEARRVVSACQRHYPPKSARKALERMGHVVVGTGTLTAISEPSPRAVKVDVTPPPAV